MVGHGKARSGRAWSGRAWSGRAWSGRALRGDVRSVVVKVGGVWREGIRSVAAGNGGSGDCM